MNLFGTDGIRGTAGQYPMTVDMAVATGRAVATFAAKYNHSKTAAIVVGKDTRESGDMLVSGLCAGICDMGVNVRLVDVLPTPGVAFLTRSLKADAGIVVSASHNPYMDNGIKIFNNQAFKLSVAREAELEEHILSFARSSEPPAPDGSPGRVFPISDAGKQYVAYLQSIAESGRQETGQKKIRLVIDCANGAASTVAPDVFPEATVLFAAPDGKNINHECGSEHPESLCREVVSRGAVAGFAFDGDGDRLIAVDEAGKVLSGDRIIALCAGFLKERERLRNNTVVSTVMSNIGLNRFLHREGIDHVTTDVGDRHVLEKMIACEAVIGGEDSGHIIFTDHQTTGDGMLTALMICKVMRETGKTLSALASCMTVYPQELINVSVKEKVNLDTIPSIQKAIGSVEEELGDSGRVLVRYSGTQPLCRVMVEAATSEQAQAAAGRIAEAIQSEIGAG